MTKESNVEVLPGCAPPETPHEPLRAFTVALKDPTTPNVLGDHLITDSYVEERWMGYVGPLSWAIARRAARLITNSQDSTMTVKPKEWCSALGVPNIDDLLCAFQRLVRWGLATWDPGKAQMTMKRRWPDVSPTIETPAHREALLAIADLPLKRDPS